MKEISAILTIKLFLSDKEANINKIILEVSDKVISDDKQLCKTFSNFFQEAIKTLRVSHNYDMFHYSHTDPV